ncbi:Aste57867_7214 [Aphanomyces stellatus]|uniref:Aste57867_7214 protein n=1 Tax=Aphanomyces stellatus TaxID=120398 RepID=A0A485KGY5_9STRA|nr:hypothetical protein As57867_007189 [Aphanomyces stellatus]VFT84140.1 Aste57867_7214 [Aphanomyces stellatus]
MTKRNLTNEEREAILREMFLRSNGKCIERMPNGFGPSLASKYGCDESTISRMLARAKSQGVTDGNMAVSVASRIKDRSGRKKKHTPTEVKAELLLLHLIERTTLRSISEKTSIALATLHRYLKHGMYRAHSSAVATWFLSAVAQPRDLDDAGCWWDGKIGTWPFVKTEAALRSSVNRPAGTNETKTITVTKDVYRFFLVDNRFFLVKKVLPAIVAKWPPGNTTVKLQHDDARAHVTATDANLCAAFASYKCVGWSFSLAPQPSNSPDLNILDLGFFAAIQFIQHRKASRNIDDLVANVCHAFDEYPSARLERTFLTTGMYGRDDAPVRRQHLSCAASFEREDGA